MRERIVPGMATIPSREWTLAAALEPVLPHVDTLYLYLDGHTELPSEPILSSKIVVLESREMRD
jgi:hypothetical protein